jgi:hypothetical protein
VSRRGGGVGPHHLTGLGVWQKGFTHSAASFTVSDVMEKMATASSPNRH